jgi:CRISPR-associated exonuclease Cas4
MLPLGLLLCALLLWLLARWARQRAGLPRGVVVYTDTRGWSPAPEPLFSPRLRLAGKPDYLVRNRHGLLPVEVKSMPAPAGGPHAAHVYQLAAYCALVEHAHGQRPPYGLIKYADQTLAVSYTPELEAELLVLLDEMRADAASGHVARSHDSSARCRGCGFNQVCGESLA